MSLLTGKTRAVVATLMFPLLLLMACSHAAPKPAPVPVTLGYCGSTLQVRPDVVLVVCDTDDITARNLTWTDWGMQTASARGSAVVDLCAYEDCAAGDYVSVPITMTVTKIVRCPKNARAYSTLRYAFPDGSPFRDVPASVSTSSSVGGEDQPLPPSNQTVSLTC